ncbi:MAG TPA: hypothetical protein ENJ28_00810 [Gammaproteobacteria bacterium]|nr:hypothetical protein [Gammaproteobacteria bacterium]
MSGNNPKDPDEFATQVGKLFIENVAKNSDFNSSMLHKENTLHVGWVITPFIAYFIICALFLWVINKGTNLYLFLFIAGILTCAWAAGATHKKVNSKTVTSIIGITSFVGILLAGGITTPQETADKVDQFVQEKTDGGK